MKHAEIFDTIKKSFCSIWTMKDRGTTLEIITPASTTTSKFISVFVKKEGDYLIVTDAGWLMDGEYDVVPDVDDEVYMRLFKYYEAHYGITRNELRYTTMFYKMTKRIDLLPNLVSDISSFLVATIGATGIALSDEKNEEERRVFSKEANSFIRTNIDKKLIIGLGASLDRKDKSLPSFNVIIKSGSKVNLVNYITGSSFFYFSRSISKAAADFRILGRHAINGYVNKKLTMVNDLAGGYKPDRLYSYLEDLRRETTHEPVLWSKKESLLIEII